MSQKLLIETLNSIKQISIQIVQQQVEQSKQKDVCEQIIQQEQFLVQEIHKNIQEPQNQKEQIQTTNQQELIESGMKLQLFNQTKQYLKNILKKVNVNQVTHILQNKVTQQKNEKKKFLNYLLEQSIIFSWYNILLQQKKVKDFFLMCIQQKNQEFSNEIQEVFEINLIKTIQTNDQKTLMNTNQKLVELGKKILLYQNNNAEENMIHFEQICLKVVKDEQIDEFELNSIPLQYFLRYCMQLTITSFDVFSRLYLIYNDDKDQIKIKNLWINKKLAFENDFPIFINIKKNKVFYYLCLTIKLTENELEEKLANLKRNSYNQNRNKSPIKKRFNNSDSTNKNNDIYRDKFFKKKQLKRKSNYQIRFDQSKETKKFNINNKYQNNIYEDLEHIGIEKKQQIDNKTKPVLCNNKEDFPTSKLNILKNSIKKQAESNQQESQRSKTVQNKKFNKSIIDLKITDKEIKNEKKKKDKSKQKILDFQNKKNNGIFSYRRTNESFDNQNQQKGLSIEKKNQKLEDYTLKPNISKLIRKSNKFQSIRNNDQTNENLIQQKSNTSLEKKNQNFFQVFKIFDNQIDNQLSMFHKNDKVLSFCLRKQQINPSIENNSFSKKYNLKSNKGFQYRQKSDNTYTPKNLFYKGQKPLLNFTKQNSQNNYISQEKINILNLQNNQTYKDTDL